MDRPAPSDDEDVVEPDRSELRAIGRRAVRDAVPLFLPAVPFGFVIGLEITRSPMPDGIGLASSALVFAGASQLALITLLGSAGFGAAVLTAIVLNARHVMYSAALAPAFRRQPRWFRWVGPFTLIDQAFALSVRLTDRHPALFRRYYLALSSVFYPGWVLTTAVGLVIGGSIPAPWRLGFAPALMFTGMVVLGLDRRPAAVAAVVGAGVCLAALGLPNRSGLLVGAAAGILAGTLSDRGPRGRVSATGPSASPGPLGSDGP